MNMLPEHDLYRPPSQPAQGKRAGCEAGKKTIEFVVVSHCKNMAS